MLVLVVSVKVKPGRADDYIAAVQADGAGTHANEEGNFQFSAVRDQADPDRFFLFEVYKDEAASGSAPRHAALPEVPRSDGGHLRRGDRAPHVHQRLPSGLLVGVLTRS